MRVAQVLAVALAAYSVNAAALDVVPYSEQLFSQLQSQNKPFALHFYAPWCPTCLVQERVIDGLKTDPALQLTVVRVEYDKEIELRRSLKIPAQSVILIYRGRKQLDFLAGDTNPGRIRAAFTAAVQGDNR